MCSNLEFDQMIDQCLKAREGIEQLSLPKLNVKELVEVEFKSAENESVKEIDLLTRFPVQETDYMNASLSEIKLLNPESDQSNTNENNHRRNIYEVLLEVRSDKELKFDPGDSIGCLIGNYDDEVDHLINLLGFNENKSNLIEINHHSRTLSLPKKSTLFQLIKFCIELRAIPKKVDLLRFSEFCSNSKEKDVLELLSSKEGSKMYDEFILRKHFGFLDLFDCFRSCKPDLSTLLKHSINFIPRYYSVIENAVRKEEDVFINRIKIAFNVTSLPAIYGRTNTRLYGIFTGKLNQLFKSNHDLVNKMSKLSIEDEQNFYIFKRKNLMFNLKNEFKNVICISVGTGITPFLSLFKYIDNWNSVEKDKFKSKIILIHGSRTKEDCLYLDELEAFNKLGIISDLNVVYSRENDSQFKYVQDCLKSKEEIKSLVLEDDTSVYVCGDQLTMVKDVLNAFKELIDRPDADKLLKEMQKNKRYLFDAWL